MTEPEADLDWYIQRVGHLKDDLKLAEQHNRAQGREIERLKAEISVMKLDLFKTRKQRDGECERSNRLAEFIRHKGLTAEYHEWSGAVAL